MRLNFLLTTTGVCIIVYLNYFPFKQQGSDVHKKTVHIDRLSGIGISLGLFASDPLYDYHEMIDEIAQFKVQQLMVVVPLHQDLYTSDTMRSIVPDRTIRRTIQQARNHSLEVTVMPMIQLKQRSDTIWRGTLSPKNPSLWWSNYRSELRHLADIAEQNRVVRFAIGSELGSLESSIHEWNSLIMSIRRRFSGSLTYSANWDHYKDVPFWHLLDEISITAYFPIKRRELFESTWHTTLDEMIYFAQGHGDKGKPLFITEYGYPALASALHKPWDETTKAKFDPILQSELVSQSTAIILDHLSNNDDNTRLRGAMLWNWFGFGGQSDHGYTLRGRVGSATLKELLNRRASTIK